MPGSLVSGLTVGALLLVVAGQHLLHQRRLLTVCQVAGVEPEPGRYLFAGTLAGHLREHLAARGLPDAAPHDPQDPAAGPAEPGQGPQGQTAHWRNRCVQLQLAEGYVARQAQTIIEEYSLMITQALEQVLEQATALLSAAGRAGDGMATASATIGTVSQEGVAADGVLSSLNESLASVHKITAFISSVAGKTNLLALNASIEAARAGEAGQGFAVVAHEVKELATATARSATEIADTTDQLAEQATRVSGVVQGMTEGVKVVGGLTGEVSDAMREQRACLQELDLRVHDAISQMELLGMLVQGVDRRTHARVAAAGAVTLTTGHGSLPADLLDLSQGGMQCAVARSAEVQVGDRVEVAARWEGGPVQLASVVRRRGESGQRDRLGLEFTDLTPEQLTAVAAEIDLLLSGDE
jgi:methyl-accepting chemotaxis protein